MEEGAETELVGNRTECALLLMARAWGADYQQLREDADVAAVATFSSDRKRGSVLLRDSGSHAGAAASPAYTLHVKVRLPRPCAAVTILRPPLWPGYPGMGHHLKFLTTLFPLSLCCYPGQRSFGLAAQTRMAPTNESA